MKVPLLEYLDKLEATARAAPPGNWTAPPHGGGRFAGAVVSDEREPDEGYGGHLIAESCSPTVCVHMMATQPKATLALIRRLRLAVEIMEQAVPHYLKALSDGGEMEDVVAVNDARQIILEMKEPHECETRDEVPE